MNRLKYSLIFISASLIIFVSGCGVFPPPFFFHGDSHSHRHRDRDDRRIHINIGDDFQEKLEHKIHDKLDKMKIRIMGKNDSIDARMNRLHDRLEHMHIRLDSLNRDLIVMNDSLPSDINIEINLDNLDETINHSLKDLDKEIELSVNSSLSHLDDLEDMGTEDFDIDHQNFDINIEKMDGNKVMIIKYFDEDSKEWKEIKINMPHRAKRGENNE